MDYLRLIAVPTAAGLLVWVLWLLGRSRPRVVGKVAAAVAVVAMAWTAWAAWALFRAPPAPYVDAEAAVRLGPLRLVPAFRADGLSGLIVMAAAGIGLLVALYSVRAMADHPRPGPFWAWLLWTVAAVLTAALADNFVLLLLAWEVATVGLYLLIGLGGPEARAGAMKTFAMLGFADLCLLLGVVMLARVQGEANPLLLVSGARGVATGTAVLGAAYLLMVVAALAKAGAMPLHTWVPAASLHAPTPVFALLPAALDKLLGIYLLARVTFGVFAPSASLAAVLMVVGAATVLLAVMMAMIQHNLKRLLAFHAVSQVGYMVLGMGVAAYVLAVGREAGGVSAAARAVATVAFCGGLFHMLNHALYKGCLFLSAGSVERVCGTTELDRLGGLARRLPVTMVCCGVAALAISGVPPLNGFASKWLVYGGALGAGTGLATACLVVAVFGSALTLASFVKVLHSVFLGTRGSAVPAEGTGVGESGWMALAMVVLAAACVGLGVWAGPAVGGLILPAAEAVLPVPPTGVASAGWSGLVLRDGAGLWDPSAATILILLGVVGGGVLYLWGRALRVRVVENFVGGEAFRGDEFWHVSGTHFYETIRRLPVLRTLFADASIGAFDLYRLTGRYGLTVVERLRAWHSGLLAVYASWVIVGLVVLVTVLALG